MKTVSVVLISILVVVKASSDRDTPAWSYDYETQWEGYCNTGVKQSPINIMTRDAMEDKFQAHIRGPLQFRDYDSVKLRGENNDHTLEWGRSDPTESSPPLLSGGPLRGNYTFIQFHLHWLSEHAIDGMKYPLEIHFVHIKQGLSIEQALLQDDGVAVMGVLCEVHVGPGSDYALKELMEDVPALVDRGAQPELDRPIDITRLFSPDLQSYFTYHGSLTTPGCQEVVTWIVMEKPIIISDDQFKMISKVDVGTMNNYRSLQPVNRVVYRAVNPMASCANLSGPTLLATMAALANCFSSQLGRALKKGLCVLYNSKKKLFGSESKLKECAQVLG